jgi:5-methylcytosine-specific restriction endonuclease McrA
MRVHLQRYERLRYAKRVAHRDYVRRWKQEHPEAKQRENAKRKERQGGVSGNFTQAIRQTLWVRQLGECGLCGAGMVRMEIDHIEPLVLGGAHMEENIHLVHPSCNLKKGQKRLKEC